MEKILLDNKCADILKNGGFSSFIDEFNYLKEPHIGIILFLRKTDYIDINFLNYFKEEINKNMFLKITTYDFFTQFLIGCNLKDCIFDLYQDFINNIKKQSLKNSYQKIFFETVLRETNLNNLSIKNYLSIIHNLQSKNNKHLLIVRYCKDLNNENYNKDICQYIINNADLSLFNSYDLKYFNNLKSIHEKNVLINTISSIDTNKKTGSFKL